MSIELWRAKVNDWLREIEGEEPSEKLLAPFAALYILRGHFAHDVNIPPTGPENARVEPSDPFANMVMYITDELHDADKYIQIGENEIALDELGHAEHFINKARRVAQSKEQQAMIRDLQTRHDLMAQSLK